MPILQERQDKNTIKIFMKHSVPVEIKKKINVFTFYSLIFMLRVLSSAIEPAVRFLRTLPTGCLQQDVVNENSNF